MYSNVTPPALPDYNPVGLYSYNGVELPALPEWDVEKYPYVVIGATANGGAAEGASNWLYVCSMRPYQNSSGEVVLGNADAQCRYAPYYGNGLSTDWGTLQLNGIRTVTSMYNVWTNTDILHEDGTLYLAASEPVPVLAYPYSVMVYDYQKGAEDWYQVHLYYSATPFTWNGEAVGNSGTVYKRIYDAAYDGWTEESETEIEASPGLTGTTYQRIYTDHDIKDSAGNIWLAAGSVTEAEEIVTEKWLRSFQAGLALGLTGNAQYMLSTPSYIWDEESGALTVIRDDGSLRFLFDQNTFNMEVIQKQ